MAWAGAVTDRGSASAQYEASADIAAFTGNANSLICVLVSTGNAGEALLASNISGHDGGGAWVEIANIIGVTESRRLQLFAAHEGGSPSNEALIVNVNDSYIWSLQINAFELTDVDVSGTVLQSFGTPDTDEEYPGSPASIALTTASHSNAEGLSLVCGLTWNNDSTHTCTGYTLASAFIGARATHSYSYLSGEDTAQTIGMTGYTQHCAIMAEVVGVAAAGANPKGPFGLPLHGPFGGPIS